MYQVTQETCHPNGSECDHSLAHDANKPDSARASKKITGNIATASSVPNCFQHQADFLLSSERSRGAATSPPLG